MGSVAAHLGQPLLSPCTQGGWPGRGDLGILSSDTARYLLTDSGAQTKVWAQAHC